MADTEDSRIVKLDLEEAIEFINTRLVAPPIDFYEILAGKDIKEAYLQFKNDEIIAVTFPYEAEEQLRATSIYLAKKGRKQYEYHPVYGDKEAFKNQDKITDKDRIVWYNLIKDL